MSIEKFVSTFEYKLIYVFKIDDINHKGMYKVGEATLHTNKIYSTFQPNCSDLNYAAKQRINQYTVTAGIVIQNINQNTNTINASIEVQINEAKKQAEDLGLGDAQFKELMEQLNRIEEISKSNESKGNKWKKAKEILKWVAEQGIQVAGVVVPVLTTMFMK